MKWARYSKAIAAAAGAMITLAVAIANGSLDNVVAGLVMGVGSAVTTLLVYLLPNTEG